jgi:hypothetical protein
MKLPELDQQTKINPRRCPICGQKNLNCKIQRISLHISTIQCNFNKIRTQELILRPVTQH